MASQVGVSIFGIGYFLSWGFYKILSYCTQLKKFKRRLLILNFICEGQINNKDIKIVRNIYSSNVISLIL